MSALDEVLECYRDYFGKLESGNRKHQQACIEVDGYRTRIAQLETVGTKVHVVQCECDICLKTRTGELAELKYEVERLKAVAKKAIEFAQDGWVWAGNINKEAWGYENQLVRLKLAVDQEEQR